MEVHIVRTQLGGPKLYRDLKLEKWFLNLQAKQTSRKSELSAKVMKMPCGNQAVLGSATAEPTETMAALPLVCRRDCCSGGGRSGRTAAAVEVVAVRVVESWG